MREPETLPDVSGSDVPRQSPFGWRDPVWLLAAYIGAQILAVLAYVGFLFMRFGSAQGRALITSPDGLNRLAVIGGVACSFAVILLFWRMAVRKGLGWRAFGFTVPPVKWLWLTALAFLATRAVSAGLTYLAGDAIAAQGVETMNGVISSDLRWNIVSAFLFVLVVPVLEEMIFRVVLFRALTRRMSVGAAACLSVAVFAAIHVQYTLAGGAVALLMTTEVALLGGVLMWLYLKSGSIWPSIALHAANNGFAIVMLLFAL